MDYTRETSERDDQAAESGMSTEPAPPILSRFLFVDVAALRAKQLRRGATVRFGSEPGTPVLVKAERVAMEEVRRGLVPYNVAPGRDKRSEDDE